MKKIIRAAALALAAAISFSVPSLAAGVTPNIKKEPPVLSDVAEESWYRDAVEFIVSEGLIELDGEQFCPEAPADRATVVTALWKLAGAPKRHKPQFEDVQAKDASAAAIGWAQDMELVTGYEGKFRPGDPITREEFAAMLYRYAQMLGLGFTGDFILVLHYNDRAQVALWAFEAVGWLSAAEVVHGDEALNFNPKANITRGELAAMLQRFENKIGSKDLPLWPVEEE